ncbi:MULTISPECIES: hypothetical protein [Nostocaceae]|nr:MULTISPECIES: hypothetical protein [Nostocaceae]
MRLLRGRDGTGSVMSAGVVYTVDGEAVELAEMMRRFPDPE